MPITAPAPTRRVSQREGDDVAASLGWLLQVGGLVVVGSALLIGLFQGALRVEIALMAFGGAAFLVGRWLRGDKSA